MQNNLFDLHGKRALITGAAQGIGFLLANGLAEYGAEIIVNDITSEKTLSAVEKLRNKGFTAYSVPFDVTKKVRLKKTYPSLKKKSVQLIF